MRVSKHEEKRLGVLQKDGKIGTQYNSRNPVVFYILLQKNQKFYLQRFLQLVKMAEFNILKIYIKRKWGVSYGMEARTGR